MLYKVSSSSNTKSSKHYSRRIISASAEGLYWGLKDRQSAINLIKSSSTFLSVKVYLIFSYVHSSLYLSSVQKSEECSTGYIP